MTESSNNFQAVIYITCLCESLEERVSRVEPVDWASDEEGSMFDHEVEPIQVAVAQTLRPIIFKSVLALSSVGSTQD